jgi:hypothetical protein
MNAADIIKRMSPQINTGIAGIGGINHAMNNTMNNIRIAIIKYAIQLSRPFKKFVRPHTRDSQGEIAANTNDITIGITMRVILKGMEKESDGGGINLDNEIASHAEMGGLLGCFIARNSILAVKNRTPLLAISPLIDIASLNFLPIRPPLF